MFDLHEKRYTQFSNSMAAIVARMLRAPRLSIQRESLKKKCKIASRKTWTWNKIFSTTTARPGNFASVSEINRWKIALQLCSVQKPKIEIVF